MIIPIIIALSSTHPSATVKTVSDAVQLYHRSYIAWDYASTRLDGPISEGQKLVWSFHTTRAVIEHGQIRSQLRFGPELLVAVSWRESKLDSDAVLPGCPRRGRRPRFCNTDGRPDVGLCQLRVGPSWSHVTLESAKQPGTNLIECARQLATHWRAHHGKGCEKRNWSERWPTYGHHQDHLWLQHHNPGNPGHGAKVLRLWRSVRRAVKREMNPRTAWI